MFSKLSFFQAQRAHEIRMNKMNVSNTEDNVGLLEDFDSDEDDDRSTEEYQNTQENFPGDGAMSLNAIEAEEKFSEADEMSGDKDSEVSKESSEKGSRDVSDDEDESQKSFGSEEQLVRKNPTPMKFDLPSPVRLSN